MKTTKELRKARLSFISGNDDLDLAFEAGLIEDIEQLEVQNKIMHEALEDILECDGTLDIQKNKYKKTEEQQLAQEALDKIKEIENGKQT